MTLRSVFKALSCLVLIALTFSALPGMHAAAQSTPPGWINFGSDAQAAAPALAVTAASPGAIDLLALTPGAFAEPVTLAGVEYSRLVGEGYGHGSLIGAPDLPVLRRDVEIPFGARASIEIIAAEYRDVSLASLGLTAILPLQPPRSKCAPAESAAPDAALYGTDAFYPAEPVALGGEYEVRGHRALTVEVNPVAYNPATGALRLYSRLEFRIRLAGSDMARTERLAQRFASPVFDAQLARQLLNYNQGRAAASTVNAPVGYLIVSADAYVSGLANFVTLKQSQGFTVTLASTTSICGASTCTTTQIKTYIQNAYNTWNPAPSYVLLVGDHNDGADSIPAWAFPGYSGFYTDLYYVTMGDSSDYVPDIYRGRFPVRDTTQLANMVANNQTYAGFSGTEPWVKKAAFLATGNDGDWSLVEGTHNYCINTYTLPLGYTGIFPANPQAGGDKLYAHTYSATGANVVSSVNDWRAMVIYSGHGSTTSWANPPFTQTNVRNITDGRLSPYVVGHACVTADYNTAEAFSDTWVIQPNRGALVYVGASNNSYWDEDDKLQRVMFDTLYDAAPGDPNISQMLYAGLAAVQATYPLNSKYYWEEYNLFGDPSLGILLGPRQADFSLEVNPTQLAICAAASANATVTLGSINGFASPVTLSLGGAPAGVSGGFSPTPATPPTTSTLTVTNDGTATAGNYPLTVQGVSGALTHTADLGLTVFSAVPAAPVLISPAHGASLVPVLATFTWQAAAQATSYTLQVATDAAFSNLVVNQGGISGTSYTLTSPLESDTTFHWRVMATNLCGDGAFSTANRFTTVPLPGDCPSGSLVTIVHETDFESGASGWTDDSSDSFHWGLSTVRAHSVTTAWLAVDAAVISDQRLVSPAITLPADQTTLTLAFWNWHAFEGSAGMCTDGGALQISTDGGTSWTWLPNSVMLTQPYDGVIRTGVYNPLGGKAAWCGSRGWTKAVVDLSAYQGQTVQFRFRLGTSDAGGAEGWYIDDVRVQGCKTIEYKFFLPQVIALDTARR